MRGDREVPIPKALAEVGPVSRVWVIAQSMPTAKRAEVLAACKRLGINGNTAKTQYQLWRYSRSQAQKARALPDKVKRQVHRAADIEVRV